MSEGPRRLLIVDDDPDVIDRVEQLCAGAFEVVSTADWVELNALFFRQAFDLVLMDVNLPTLKGDRLVAVLKAMPSGGGHTPIVYFSAEDEATLARLVRDTGADGYICKSWRAPVLLGAIERFAGEAPG